MARRLNIVPSEFAVAQFAGSIGTNIITLKALWSQVKEAPAEINNLLGQIDSLNLMLQHMQDDRSRPSALQLPTQNLCVQRSLDLCKQCALELSTLAKDLAAEVQDKNGWRKKLGSAKVVLSKQRLESLQWRLKAAMDMLQLSYQFHTSAMIQFQPDIIVTRIATHLDTSRSFDGEMHCREQRPLDKKRLLHSSNLVERQYDHWTVSSSWMRFVLGQFEYWHQQNTRSGKWQENFYARYKLPDILSHYQFTLWARRPLSGLWLNCKIHRTVSKDDSFFLAVEQGNLPIVESLLAEKKAYVTDTCNLNNNTALHLAAQLGNPEMCRLLLNEGADPLAMNKFFETPLQNAINYGGFSSFTRAGDSLGTCRLLVEDGADDILIDEPDILTQFHGPLCTLKYLQRQVYPPYQSISQNSRLRIASRYLGKPNGWHNLAFLAETLILPSGISDAQIMSLAGDSGWGFFQSLIYAWKDAHYEEWTSVRGGQRPKPGTPELDTSLETHIVEELRGTDYSSQRLLGLRPLICKIILAGFWTQRSNSSGPSPLAEIICKLPPGFRHHSPLGDFSWVKRLTTDWLEILFNCGVDLGQYGIWETMYFQSQGFKPDHSPFEGDDTKCYVQWNASWHFRWIAFTFGPRVEDWNFWYSEPTDEFAGDFWQMIEEVGCWESDDEESDSDLTIPGAWSDEF